MKFNFDEGKTAQAAAYLVSRSGGALHYMGLIKLLYLADRQSLIERGLPITGDNYVSMKNGPVLSQTYGIIRKTRGSDGSWGQYIGEPSQFMVPALADTSTQPLDRLSPFELRILDEVFAKYGHLDEWHLVKVTHDVCPEWEDPGASSAPIDPTDILIAAGVPMEDIEHFSKELDQIEAVRRRYARP